MSAYLHDLAQDMRCCGFSAQVIGNGRIKLDGITYSPAQVRAIRDDLSILPHSAASLHLQRVSGGAAQ